MAFSDYRGIKRLPAATGPAGIVLNDNFSELADRSGPIFSGAGDPSVNDDEANTIGNGYFYQYSKWLNSVTKDLFVCIDSTPTAAVWYRLHYDGIIDPNISNSLIIDTVQVVFLPDQATFLGSVFYGDGGSNLTDNGSPDGRYNTSVGIGALATNTEGDSNKAFGYQALEDNTLGARNLAFGYHALRKNIDGNNNVALGDECLMDNTGGDENVCIGNLAGNDITGNGNVCIGHQAGDGQIAINNRLYIHNSNTASPLIYGEFDNRLLVINGELLATDKVIFTQTDGDEYIDSLADGFMDYGATTAHRFNNDVKIPSDTDKLYLGASDDYTIEYDGLDAVHTITTAGSFIFAGGYVGIGTPTVSNPLYPIHASAEDANDSAITIIAAFDHMVTGGAAGANGIGSAFILAGAGSTGTRAGMVRFVGMFDDVTAGTQKGAFRIDLNHHGNWVLNFKVSETETNLCGDVTLRVDNQKIFFGAADDAYIEFDGNSMNIVANAVTGTDNLNLTADDITLNGAAITAESRVRNMTTVNAATYDVLVTDDIVHVTYTVTAAVTSLTLMTNLLLAGRHITIKDAGGNAAANHITIDTEGAEKIDGQDTQVIIADYDSVDLYTDGSNWFII